MTAIKQFKDKNNQVVRASLGWSDTLPEIPMWEIRQQPEFAVRLLAPIPVFRLPPPPLLNLDLPFDEKARLARLAWGAAGIYHNDRRILRSKPVSPGRQDNFELAVRILTNRSVDLWTWCAYAQANTFGKHAPTMARWLTEKAVRDHLETVVQLRPPIRGWVQPVEGTNLIQQLRQEIWNAVASNAQYGLSTCCSIADKIITEAEFQNELDKLDRRAEKQLKHFETQLKKGEWPWPKHANYGTRE